jgi:sugar/nucleoside kinase (ribokinase family)
MVSLAVVGNVNVDVLAWPAGEVPPPGVERPLERIDVRVGGAAAITAAVLARLGHEPVVAGCVGDDALGAAALGELEAHGVDTSSIRRIAGSTTGVSIAFEAPGRDRSFLIALGSLGLFEASMVPVTVTDASIVLVCGYFNLPGMRGRDTEDLLRAVKAAGGTTMFDTGWDHDGWADETRDEVGRLLRGVDVFLPNAAEAERVSGEDEPAAAARSLSAASGGWTVVKLGSDGCVAVGPDGTAHRAAAPIVDVVDTTGAGDAFNAGVMDALASGRSWQETLRAACEVASAVVARPSADRYPTAADLADRR